MFAKIALHFIALSALASQALAGPLALRPKYELGKYLPQDQSDPCSNLVLIYF
jgi:hypothetical protein